MTLDIILVTYNSEKWIKSCINSLAASTYDKKKINICIVDNASIDSTRKLLIESKEIYSSTFGSFEIVINTKNLGFGRANNIGAEKGKSEYILFLNIDTNITKDSIKNAIESIIKSDDSIGAWELRQFPYEQPKYYDPVTLYTSWISGAAFIIKRHVFKEVKGFDSNIFLYAEDVDLSWRIRAKGYNLKYLPDSVVYHFTYENENEIKPNQYIYSVLNNLNLRIRYGDLRDIFWGILKFVLLLIRKQPFKGARSLLFTKSILNLKTVFRFYIWRFSNKIHPNFKPQFIGWDYEVTRTGAFFTNNNNNNSIDSSPLVSILIRTHGRINYLREALTSVRNQTYKNIEVVVVEDGPNISESAVLKEFSDLNVIYKSTEENKGRSQAANIAIDLANGDFLNFLDDDDLLFSDHVEVLVNEAIKNNKEVVYSIAFEVPTKVFSIAPYKENMNYKTIYRQPFNRLKLFYQNYLPIQTVMFRKYLVKDKIYMDINLDALEDWDFWIRVALKSDFHMVDKTTSLYRVPFDKTESLKRQIVLDSSLELIREKKKKYLSNISVFNAAKEVEELISQNKMEHYKQKYRYFYKFYLISKKIFK